MIVKDKWGSGPMSVTEALNDILRSSCDGGRLECLEDRIDKLHDVLVRYLATQVRTVDDLNTLADYERFEEVKK